MPHLVLFNSALPWHAYGPRQRRPQSLALKDLRLHETLQSFFDGTIVEADEQKKKVADFLVEHQAFLRKRAHYLAEGTILDEADLVQNTCKQVLEKWHQWQGPAFEPWLRQILQTVFLKEIRREKLRMPVDIGEVGWERVEDQRAGTAADAVVVRLDVAKTMTNLSPDHQEILLLAIKGLSHDELAEALGIPKGTVMSRLKRARDQFRHHASLDQGQEEAEA